MSHLIEVAFRGNRKEFFQWDAEDAPALRAGVIVEADRGEDFGRVHSAGELAEVRCKGCAHGCGTTPPPRRALRLATAEETSRDDELTAENEQARRRAMERVKANNLVMKLTDAEWQWDRRKLTFFFTAERRVDFRALVRDLAAMFRARIELKQIGVRDEAKRLSGIGRCGREYCSASWLPDLRPVNLGVAKDQKLSLNPQQISGACGRLMCCLRYEHEFYVQSRRRFPKEGRILVTTRGEEKVISCDIFNDRVTLRSAEGDTRVVPLAELRQDIGGFNELLSAEPVAVAGDEDDELSDTVLDHAEKPVRSEVARPSPAAVISRAPVAPREATPAIVVSVPVTTSAPKAAIAGDTADAAVTNNELGDVRGGAAPADDARTSDARTSDARARDANMSETRTSDAPASDARTGDASSGTEPRRKRRRGRRGGRRLRAAEQRRQELDGIEGADSIEAGDEDDDIESESPTST